MPYVYRISRVQPVSRFIKGTVSPPIPAPVLQDTADDLTGVETSYRDLQRQAKARGISAKQTADQLRKALAEAEHG